MTLLVPFACSAVQTVNKTKFDLVLQVECLESRFVKGALRLQVQWLTKADERCNLIWIQN